MVRSLARRWRREPGPCCAGAPGQKQSERRAGTSPVCRASGYRRVGYSALYTGRHARLGTRLLARLCRGRHLRRLSSIRFQGATRSSNRTCSFPASGFPTGFIIRHTTATLYARDSAAAHPVPRRHAREGTVSCRDLALFVVCAENRVLGHRHDDQQPDTAERQAFQTGPFQNIARLSLLRHAPSNVWFAFALRAPRGPLMIPRCVGARTLLDMTTTASLDSFCRQDLHPQE
jgi:hypothetical protein